MYLSKTALIASGVSVVLAHPLQQVAREVASFPAGSSWDILLNSGSSAGNMKKVTDHAVSIIDIDLFDTDKQTIADLKTNKKVLCYFSAGTKEDWRPDIGDFQSGDVGKNMEDWAGEAWLNVKSTNVRNIMKKRIQQAAEKGCDGIDPDNTDGYGNNQDGFGYGKGPYVEYLKFLAQEAKNNGLAIGLKNSIDVIGDVIDVMSFAVNEQCHEYGECARYKPFTDHNKAVLNIEYGGNACDSPAGVKLSTLIKPEDQGLNSLGGACAGQNSGTTDPKSSSRPSPSSSAAPTPIKSAAPSQVPSKTAAPTPSKDATPVPSKSPYPVPVSSASPSQAEPSKTSAPNSSAVASQAPANTSTPSSSAIASQVPSKTSTPNTSVVASQVPSKTRGATRPTCTSDPQNDEEEEEEGEKKTNRPWRWYKHSNSHRN